MPLFSLPSEIHHLLVKDLDAEAKLASIATSRYFRSFILEEHDVSTLMKDALRDIEARPFRRVSSSQRVWMKYLSGPNLVIRA